MNEKHVASFTRLFSGGRADGFVHWVEKYHCHSRSSEEHHLMYFYSHLGTGLPSEAERLEGMEDETQELNEVQLSALNLVSGPKFPGRASRKEGRKLPGLICL